jgi:hypothetical protein
MAVIILLALIILFEKITGKMALEIISIVLKWLLSKLSWVVEFLLGMNEPRGSKS